MDFIFDLWFAHLNDDHILVRQCEVSIRYHTLLQDMLAQIQPTLLACASDDAYDKRKVYDALNAHSPDVEILIPPRKNAHIWRHDNWNKNVSNEIRICVTFVSMDNRSGSKIQAVCSSAGDTNHAGLLLCLALNRMTQLDMPESYPVA